MILIFELDIEISAVYWLYKNLSYIIRRQIKKLLIKCTNFLFTPRTCVYLLETIWLKCMESFNSRKRQKKVYDLLRQPPYIHVAV